MNTLISLVPGKTDQETAAGFKARLNQALREHIHPIIQEIEAQGFIATFERIKDRNGHEVVQVSYLAKYF